MGVSTCSRTDCEEIMPRTYISGIGYICYDCRSEFTKMFENKFGSGDQQESVIEKELKAFMETKKSSGSDELVSPFDYFSKHTM